MSGNLSPDLEGEGARAPAFPNKKEGGRVGGQRWPPIVLCLVCSLKCFALIGSCWPFYLVTSQREGKGLVQSAIEKKRHSRGGLFG